MRAECGWNTRLAERIVAGARGSVVPTAEPLSTLAGPVLHIEVVAAHVGGRPAMDHRLVGHQGVGRPGRTRGHRGIHPRCDGQVGETSPVPLEGGEVLGERQ